MGDHTAFFYGTLMHPKILKAVIRNNGSHLKVCPAVLLDHTRHEVKYNDYPGVVSIEKGAGLFERPLTQEERSVRGTVVTGLTDSDMTALDNFEGDEYIRRKVQVHSLGPFVDVATHPVHDEALIPPNPPPIPDIFNLPQAISAETYIYTDVTCLKPDLWSYSEFVKNNAWKWYGGTR
ncbi:hypothetical protein D9613_007797 [Agrocybe pediades]|uniref:Putative gamma-glutamylcyclotransferase n=1 Tax=Agrocybe pediades TaxID=84607 RepID=A0A8H4QNZ0_9AGAR|nr:hypothetical protein D9613_007797 [Agrocybe pediades]